LLRVAPYAVVFSDMNIRSLLGLLVNHNNLNVSALFEGHIKAFLVWHKTNDKSRLAKVLYALMDGSLSELSRVL
jgi:hypothetical protein